MHRVAMVTGAAGGLGAATCRELARTGHAVALADRDEAGATALGDELGPTHLPVPIDVTEEGSVAAAFDTVEHALGPVGVLVCCAGGTTSTRARQPELASTTVEDWIATEAVNARGTFLCVREMLRRRKARPVPAGRIVLVASAAAHRPAVAAGAAYGAAKAAVISLGRTAAVEAAPFGLTVNTIAPGAFDTALYHHTTSAAQSRQQLRTIPIGRLGDPAEFAATVAFLVTEQAGYLTGATIDLNGGSRMA